MSNDKTMCYCCAELKKLVLDLQVKWEHHLANDVRTSELALKHLDSEMERAQLMIDELTTQIACLEQERILASLDYLR